MKQQPFFIFFFCITLIFSGSVFFSKPSSILHSIKKSSEKEEEEEEEMEKEEMESGVRSSYNLARLLYDYSMIKDPGTGRIPNSIYNKEMEEARTIRTKGSRTGSGARERRTSILI